ncbi:MAG TPA: DNA methyltransferase [Bacteroidales bacterium]|nr:DNA methyltransferase [Bacteroidales bacterium]HXK82396.1 DNA methyltransferase [Bacteroidales bacterium]
MKEKQDLIQSNVAVCKKVNPTRTHKINKDIVVIKETGVSNKYKSKIIDDSWDFRKANTKEMTHCFHSYPAMMIPQVARRIIENYGKDKDVLFDPYCGTGTSLVEANIQNINAIGTDVNPLARLISKAKTTKISFELLNSEINKFVNYSFNLNFKVKRNNSIIIPQVINIDYWFSKNTQEKLAVILKYIGNINEPKIADFFKVAFSETVRAVSYVKSGEFKMVRSKYIHDKNDIDVFGIMAAKLSRNKNGLFEFSEICKNDTKSIIYDFNTVENIPNNLLKFNSIDIVVTSPPYGDSRTTVAYGQFSRLANEWLGYNAANQIDNMLMGGKRRKCNYKFSSKDLNEAISKIKSEDAQRARDVISFYEDYENSIKNVSKVIKKGGFACYVVGNRTVKGITIPTDEVTAQIFEDCGFIHLETIIRNIPSKRMPYKNSPSNVKGLTSSTMKNEYIVICQKL